MSGCCVIPPPPISQCDTVVTPVSPASTAQVPNTRCTLYNVETTPAQATPSSVALSSHLKLSGSFSDQCVSVNLVADGIFTTGQTTPAAASVTIAIYRAGTTTGPIVTETINFTVSSLTLYNNATVALVYDLPPGRYDVVGIIANLSTVTDISVHGRMNVLATRMNV